MGVIYTIGHSNRSLDDFIATLSHYHISTVADVRSLPHSRANPHFNKEVLEYALPRSNVAYSWMGKELGGFRPQTLTESPNTAWRVKGFRNYADYALTDEFSEAISQLSAVAAEQITVCMCAEVLWTRCHRRIIADYLSLRGWEVMHILNTSRSTPHELTPFAKVDDELITYPSSLSQYSLEDFELK
ncbi:MAG: DUF488 domain-containing protein [Euryarchaeota archaeon]|nr:DUF488 domain-containing protein [Euryarchaeota archaeon]